MNTKTQPYRLSNMLVGNFGELVNDLLHEDYAGSRSLTSNPRIEVRDMEKEYFVNIAIPGVKKEDISIAQKENYVTISGKYAESISEGKQLVNELPKGSFLRKILLPKNANKDKIGASLENGILHLTIEKLVEVAPAKIEIK